MDLSSLEIFRAVAGEASVTRAAQRLQRAQSNVTTRIRQLEEDLGVELFLRDGKRMSLTERGSQFLAYAEQLLALADEARQSMHPAEPGGRLRLGSMESTAASRLPALLATYHKACPRSSWKSPPVPVAHCSTGCGRGAWTARWWPPARAGPVSSMAAACAASRCSARNC